MPRKKITLDPLDTVLQYFASAPLESALLVHRIAGMALANRTAAQHVSAATQMVARTRQGAITPTPMTPPATATTAADAPPKQRRRRMSATSPRPASEATPIVPQQATVGEDEQADDVNDNDQD